MASDSQMRFVKSLLKQLNRKGITSKNNSEIAGIQTTLEEVKNYPAEEQMSPEEASAAIESLQDLLQSAKFGTKR